MKLYPNESDLLIDRFPIHFCTIDKIELLADLAVPVDVLSNILSTEVEFLPQNFTSYPYRYLIPSLAEFNVLIRDQSNTEIPYLKIIFNPNIFTYSPGFHKIMGILKNQRFSRIDYAVDYPFSLSGYKFFTDVPKKGGLVTGRDQSIETINLGIKSSGTLGYTIYNKSKKEKLGNNITLWRIEAKLRLTPGMDYLDIEPFKDLLIVNPEYMQFPNINDRAMLYYLSNHADEWHLLDPRKRRKYKDLLKNSDNTHQLYPHPYQSYLSGKGRLLNQLQSYLGGSNND